jgi:hypothetical protein
MKKFVALIAASLFAVAPVFAQTPVAAASAAPAAQAPALDPAALAAAKDLVTALKMRDMLVASLQQASQNASKMVGQVATKAINENPKLNDEQKKESLAKFEKSAPAMTAALQEFFSDAKLIDEMVDEIAPLYASNFTAAEIGQIAAFYKTPIGAKTLKVMPQLVNQSMQASQKVMMPRLNKLMEKIAQSATK